jgi:hypothetical protein
MIDLIVLLVFLCEIPRRQGSEQSNHSKATGFSVRNAE